MARSINIVPITALLLFVCSAPSYADAGLLRTVQALDEARGYCLDIAGEGPTLRLDDALQAHTCKYGGPLDDQRFEHTAGGAIRATMYDRCLAAASLEPGAKLLVRSCASVPTQLWSMAWGRLSPASRPDLCVSLAGDKGQPAGTPTMISPVYHRRDVSLDRCDAAREGNQSFRWSQPQERGLSSAEITRQGMPADIATQLMAQRQVMATWLVDGLLQRSALRDDVDRAAAIDTLWTLMDPALFCRLTGDRHWSATRFRRWFTDSTLRLLLPVHDQQATATSRTQEVP